MSAKRKLPARLSPTPAQRLAQSQAALNRNLQQFVGQPNNAATRHAMQQAVNHAVARTRWIAPQGLISTPTATTMTISGTGSNTVTIYPITSATSTGTWPSSNVPTMIPPMVSGSGYYADDPYYLDPFMQQELDVPEDWQGAIKLPDGSRLVMDGAGNYQIDDSKAKVIYKANRARDFNPYLNASDLLEEFVGWLKQMGLTFDQARKLPLEMFVMWLVVRAAERDGDEPPQEQKLLTSRVRRRRRK